MTPSKWIQNLYLATIWPTYQVHATIYRNISICPPEKNIGNILCVGIDYSPFRCSENLYANPNKFLKSQKVYGTVRSVRGGGDVRGRNARGYHVSGQRLVFLLE